MNKSVIFISLAVFSSPAAAYIDPGTGSLIIQSIIGAIAAIAVTMKLYWHKLKVFFRKKETVIAEEETDTPDR